MTSSVHDPSSDSDNGGPDGQQKQSQGSQPHIQHQPPATGTVLPAMASPSAEFMMPHPSVGMGHNMAQTAYAYPHPYYAGMIAAYGGQAPIPPHLFGMQQAGVPLPSDAIEEPVYVNAKQYHGILRRRQLRAKAESENKSLKNRKPYMHESRHLHALKRARGCGGRFLNGKGDKDQNKEAPADNNPQSITSPDPNKLSSD